MNEFMRLNACLTPRVLQAAPTSPQAMVVALPRTRLRRTSSRYDLGEQKRRRRLGEPEEESSLRRIEVPICKFIKRSTFFVGLNFGVVTLDWVFLVVLPRMLILAMF